MRAGVVRVCARVCVRVRVCVCVDINKGYKIKATCSKHFVLVTTLAVITAAKLLTKERGERID